MEDRTKGKILVIDDNEDILFALNLLLKPLVEDIRVTTQPEQIDRFYDVLHPDVVLLDMNYRRDAISGEEGFEWLEHILHHDPQAVVILMTAYADGRRAARGRTGGQALGAAPQPCDDTPAAENTFRVSSSSPPVFTSQSQSLDEATISISIVRSIASRSDCISLLKLSVLRMSPSTIFSS